MKKTFLPIAVLAFFTSQAQLSTKAFALTDAQKGGFQWNQVQAIDLSTGTISKTVLDGRKSTALVKYEGANLVTNNAATVNTVTNPQILPLGQTSAALAYDEQNNRIYFSSMFQLGEVRFMNLGEAQPYVHVVKFAQKSNSATDREADNFTRMVIGSDGNGYAITNDGNTFVRFTTGKEVAVQNLGGLIDNVKNGATSVHSKASWGGDMIADAFGKLYLVTVNKNIFKIDPNTRVATFIGSIQGLPTDFTCNAAAVAATGKLVVASANKASGYYTLNLEDMNASLVPGSENSFNASDLATSNLYGQDKINKSLAEMDGIELNRQPSLIGDKVSIYPNPIVNGRVNILFDQLAAGKYTITLVDQAGHNITQQEVNVSGKGQTATMYVAPTSAKGMYHVKINANDSQKPQIFSDNVIVE